MIDYDYPVRQAIFDLPGFSLPCDQLATVHDGIYDMPPSDMTSNSNEDGQQAPVVASTTFGDGYNSRHTETPQVATAFHDDNGNSRSDDGSSLNNGTNGHDNTSSDDDSSSTRSTSYASYGARRDPKIGTYFDKDDPAWNFFDKLRTQEDVLNHMIHARVKLVNRKFIDKALFQYCAEAAANRARQHSLTDCTACLLYTSPSPRD